MLYEARAKKRILYRGFWQGLTGYTEDSGMGLTDHIGDSDKCDWPYRGVWQDLTDHIGESDRILLTYVFHV